jgi:hypothetical protein
MIEGKSVVKVKSSQKIFTDAEIASLTGICVEHLHSLAADQWLFTLSDLMVLVRLYPHCEH